MTPSATDSRTWRRYLRFYRADPVADFDDELRDHLESTTAALMRDGLSATAARDEALRRFGNINAVRNEVQRMDAIHQRRSRIAAAVETFAQDSTFAMRMLRRSPAFALVAMLSIALAVAANTTVFSVVNALLLRPIPGAAAPRLMRVYVNHHSPFSYNTLAWFRDHQQSFDGIVGERSGAMSFNSAGGQAERVHTSAVTRGFFTTLGVPFALGTGFAGDETAAAASAPVVVLGHQFWQRNFASDSSIVGKAISLAGHPVVVVGVTAPAFRSSVVGWAPDVIIPVAALPTLTGEKLEDIGGSLYSTARLKPGTNSAKAGAELNSLMTQLARTDTARYSRTTVRLDHTRGVNAELRPFVLAGSSFLMLMVGLVLLIACANVANLLLGRAASRHGEIGLRLALGAGRYRIIRQLLTESLFLAVSGSILGLIATVFLTRAAVAIVPAEAGMASSFFQPDARVFAFTMFVCILTTLLFGLVPALRAAAPGVVTLIKGAAQQQAKRSRGKLVALQAALCVL
ncbi:MAG: ABC transporter permease, partial [Phycisphaerae bacterium]|nr:ABC transporter permease [Gemmatimonadaceae bacterium]